MYFFGPKLVSPALLTTFQVVKPALLTTSQVVKPTLLTTSQVAPRRTSSHYPLGAEYPTATIYRKPETTAVLDAERATILSKATTRTPDLETFVYHLCRPLDCLPFLQKIDAEVGKLLALEPGDSIALLPKDVLIPTLRRLVSGLSQHYGFDRHFVETGGGDVLLSPEAFKTHILAKGRLLLDLGETGHGPIPHLISACMMKEMEESGLIKDAKTLYALLAHDSKDLNDHLTDFKCFFSFAQDNIDSVGLSQPSHFANFIIENTTELPHLSALTRAICDQTYVLHRAAKSDFDATPDSSLKDTGEGFRLIE